MDLVKEVEKSMLKKKVVKLRPGYIVAVYQRVKEGKKERIQVFKGVVIKVKGGYGLKGSFTVRRVALGIGVEKTFLFNSPLIEKVVVMKKAKVRRSKLFYLRGRFGKSAKLNLLGDDGKDVQSLIREVVGDDDKEKDEKGKQKEPKTKKEDDGKKEEEGDEKAVRAVKDEKKVEKVDQEKKNRKDQEKKS
ncbi:50S ribosomal protein L19 [Patescibacteria group bacterium]|nr:50S ribosomal protein L19 [Patescibacteria group bacterium]